MGLSVRGLNMGISQSNLTEFLLLNFKENLNCKHTSMIGQDLYRVLSHARQCRMRDSVACATVTATATLYIETGLSI